MRPVRPDTLARRLELLARLIRQREQSAEQTARYWLMRSDDLTPERRSEWVRHMREQAESLRRMKRAYGQLVEEEAWFVKRD